MNDVDSIVILDVGGKLFKTRVNTLTNSSSYFEALFSTIWRESSDLKYITHDNNKALFIDKDPVPFEYLLTYMREGTINIPSDNLNLAQSIMLQAEYFGIDKLVNEIKIRSISSNLISGYVCEDAEAIVSFNMKYESVHHAIISGFLPLAFFNKHQHPVNVVVGEEAFRMHKSALEKHSGYFKRLFCSSTSMGPIFIDHDPEAFRVLAKYMRYSQLDIPKDDTFAFKRILYAALDLEMKDFLILVKARTMINIERHEAPMGIDQLASVDCPFGSPLDVSDVHYIYASQFDRRFRSFELAFSTKNLPRRFFE
jgi:hypothetical protein